MKVIGIYNFKGGVGKTTTAVNLAYLAALEGAPVLLYDLDPQGAASFYLKTRMERSARLKKIFKGKIEMAALIRETEYDNLYLLPADFSYRKLDLVLDGLQKPRHKLAERLATLKKAYKWIFIDSPPNISLVSENIFRAVDVLLFPAIPAPLSIRTYEELTVFFNKKKLDRDLIVPFYSMVQQRKKVHREIMEIFDRREPKALKTRIPFLSDLEKMGVRQKPLPAFRAKSPATLAYRELWEEVKLRVLPPG